MPLQKQKPDKGSYLIDTVLPSNKVLLGKKTYSKNEALTKARYMNILAKTQGVEAVFRVVKAR